jgi:hypothetical protein
MPASERPQTHALDRTVTGIGRPWALGTLIYEGVKLQRREEWLETVNIHTSLSSTLNHIFLFASLQLSS